MPLMTKEPCIRPLPLLITLQKYFSHIVGRMTKSTGYLTYNLHFHDWTTTSAVLERVQDFCSENVEALKLSLIQFLAPPIGRVQGQACICQLCIPGAKLTSPQYTRKIYLKMVILDRIRLPEEIPMNTNYPFLCSFIKKSGKIKMAFSPLFSIFCILVFNHFFQKRQTFLKLTPSVTFYSFLRREILQSTSFPPGHSLQLAPLSPKSQNE